MIILGVTLTESKALSYSWAFEGDKYFCDNNRNVTFSDVKLDRMRILQFFCLRWRPRRILVTFILLGFLSFITVTRLDFQPYGSYLKVSSTKLKKPQSSAEGKQIGSNLTAMDTLRKVNLLLTSTHAASYSLTYHQNGQNSHEQNSHNGSYFAPFNENQPKLLVILAYQRTGSTFLGKFLSSNPDVFYLFEPLDSLYSSLYGTMMGWNVPTDITHDRKGSQRVMPKSDVSRIVAFLHALLICNLPALPTETLVNPYLTDLFKDLFSVGSGYVPCVLKYRRSCNPYALWRHCGRRYGERPEVRLQECRRALTDEEYRRKQKARLLFDLYLNCTAHLRRAIDSECSQHLSATCLARPIRVVKLVRASMSSMEPLLHELPNLRLIHLVRDPRAVALSRANFHSSGRGLFSHANRNLTTLREAILFCQTAVNDYKLGTALKKRYPGKLLTVVYEDFVRDLAESTQEIYSLMELKIPPVVARFVSENNGTSSNSTNRWQQVLTFKQSREIWTACEEFFTTIPYPWSK